MAKELNEDTGFTVSLKTLAGIGAALATVIGMWFTLQADIAEAKELPLPPDPEITRMEFDMKDQLVRQTIMSTQEDVTEIKDQLIRLEEIFGCTFILYTINYKFISTKCAM
jgi:hypothetical protein